MAVSCTNTVGGGSLVSLVHFCCCGSGGGVLFSSLLCCFGVKCEFSLNTTQNISIANALDVEGASVLVHCSGEYLVLLVFSSNASSNSRLL